MPGNVQSKSRTSRWMAIALVALMALPAATIMVPEAAAQSTANTIRFVDQPQNTGRGLPFVPVVRVQVLNSADNPVSSEVVELRVAGSPAGVRLENGPGQGANPYPRATTNANGIASFPGLAIVNDSTTFAVGTY